MTKRMMRHLFKATLLISMTPMSLLTTTAFSTSSSSSPWCPCSWKFVLKVVPEANNKPEDWKSSTLILPFQVRITSDLAPEKDASFGGNSAYLLYPESAATFVNHRGLQTIEFGTGGWKMEYPSGGGRRGFATKLRMWIDVKTDASRNGVKLSAGERIYLEANCWREEEFEIGSQALKPYLDTFKQAQKQLEAQVAHDKGDRRLDGTDPLQTMAAYTDMAKLVAQRDEKWRQLQNAELVYPRNPDTIVEGPWPGDFDWLAISPTRITVKRRKTIMDEFLSIGSWEAQPILLDDDYVEVDMNTQRNRDEL